MKETDIGVPRATVLLPYPVRAFLRETQNAIEKRSQIVWGEHCTECAFPTCYSTCSFYTPRADFHCRRFERGIERIANRENGLELKRIQFRRWAKLEGEGKVALKSARASTVLEELDRIGERLLAGPASFLYRLAWHWNETKRSLAARGDALSPTDVFVLEAWHEGTGSWPFTFSVMPKEKGTAGLYQLRIELGPGYNRAVIAASDIAAFLDLSQSLVLQIEPVREGAPPIVFGMADFARLNRPLENRKGGQTTAAQDPQHTARPKFKCVVWDLDNTLWSGTLAEDGMDGVKLSETAAHLVRELDRRGIINSIASKNDPAQAMEVLAKFGLSDYFVFPRVGWGPKSEGLKGIIADMDVGADTFAFIDDQAFERGEIGELLPEVTVFSERELDRLLDDPRFDVPVTPESQKRRQMYKTEERRYAARADAQMDYTQFLRTCRIALDVKPLSHANLSRIYELSQRTNQLNFSGRRYSRAELERLISERPRDTFVLACNDKFGDYGIIGFAVLKEGAAGIESFFMSCRVQRKRVENAFFQFLAEELAARGIQKLDISYRKTARNGASVQMLKDLGFDYRPQNEEEGIFAVNLPCRFPDHDVVEIMAENVSARAVA